MSDINKIFGYLADGGTGALASFRFSTVSRAGLPEHVNHILGTLIPASMPAEARAFAANAVIAILQTSDMWSDFVSRDKANTYNFPLYISHAEEYMKECRLKSILERAVEMDLSNDRFPKAAWFTPEDMLINAVFIALDDVL